ncbi:MAG: DNA-directed RNA polymerase [Candidatus Diapherotrites archaeon]|nr:DNA-directed RNA polymerase [Candidatus Diapherotrites archaeon]
MYAVYSIVDTIGVPPAKFSGSVSESITNILREKYEGLIDTDVGAIVSIDNIRDVGPGMILPMDGSAYHKVKFDALTYKPELKEIVNAEVTELTAFGAFVRLGPLDGLLHVSQIMSEFISFDPKTPAFQGKDSNKILKQGDFVRARIVTSSLKSTVADTKIALTMRQPFLGKFEWIDEEKKGKKKPTGRTDKKPVQKKK